MALTIKGGGKPPPKSQTPPNLDQAAADAYARLAKKKKRGAAAEAVAGVIDEVVGDSDALEAEMAAAKKLLDEVAEDLPEGTGLDQAEAIANELAEKLDASRGGPWPQKIQAAFDALDD